MEEDQIYVASLSNVPEEDEDYLKARSCVVTIDIGNPDYEGEKLRATMKMVTLRFKECIISVNDTSRRYSLAAKDKLQRSPKELYGYSKELGDKWLERNLSKINENLKIPFKIVRWDDYLNYPKFQDHYKEVKELFTNNQEYRDIVEGSAKEYYTKNIEMLDDSISAVRVCDLSRDFLLEKCAVALEWYDQRCDYEIYSSLGGEHIRKALELLRPSNLIGHRLELDFKRTSKDKEAKEKDVYRIALENIMDIIPEHIYWKDVHSTIIGCNLNQAKIFGYETVNELIGKTVFDLFDFDMAVKMRDNDLEVMKNNKKIIVEEVAYINGEYRTYLSYKEPLLSKDNQEVIGIIGTAIDITDKKKCEQLMAKIK